MAKTIPTPDLALIAILLTLALSVLQGCSSNGDRLRERSEREIYQDAQDALDSGNYFLSIEHLQLLEARYPYGYYAEHAQLELIYAHYQANDIESTQAAASRFIRLHPTHDNVDYAYYMHALATYDQSFGALQRYLPIDTSKRNQQDAEQAFLEFNELVQRFPDSTYAADARQRMIFLRNKIAAYETYVAAFYIERKAYLAAANRAKHVILHFQGTPVIGDALAVQAEAYYRMGLEDLGDQTVQLLQANYPDHEALQNDRFKTTKAERRWWQIMTLGIFG